MVDPHPGSQYTIRAGSLATRLYSNSDLTALQRRLEVAFGAEQSGEDTGWEGKEGSGRKYVHTIVDRRLTNPATLD